VGRVAAKAAAVRLAAVSLAAGAGTGEAGEAGAGNPPAPTARAAPRSLVTATEARRRSAVDPSAA
jgi:hypothetical protein